MVAKKETHYYNNKIKKKVFIYSAFFIQTVFQNILPPMMKVLFIEDK